MQAENQNNILQRIFSSSLFFGLILGVLLAAAAFQASLSINHDVAFLLVVAKNFVEGVTLYSEIVIVNPPLIIYIYSLPVLISKMLGSDLALTFNIFMTLLLFVLSAISFYLIKQKKNINEDIKLTFLLALVIPLAFIGAEYGQREHLIVIFFVPYILSMWSYKDISGNGLRVLAGISGAIAVAIKPQFLGMLALCEIVLVVQCRSIKTLFRIEPIVLCLSGLIYLIVVWLFHRAYFTNVIPLTVDLYGQFKDAESGSAFNILHLVFPAGAIIPLLFVKSSDIKRLLILFLAAGLGAYLAYLQQVTFWLYHLLPYIIFNAIVFLAAVFVAVYARLAVNNPSLESLSFGGLLPGLLLGVLLPLLLFFGLSGSELRDNLKNTISHSSPLFIKDNSYALDESREFLKALAELPKVTSVHTFINHISPAFPAILYAGYDYKAHFPTLGFLTTAVYERRTSQDISAERRGILQSLEQSIINSTVKDFIEQTPELVIVNTSLDKNRLIPGLQEVDFLEVLTQDSRFAHIWQHYRHHSSVDILSTGNSFDFYLLDKNNN